MLSQQDKNRTISIKHELNSISESLKIIATRVHFYCSRQPKDKEQQEMIQHMLNYYANRMNQLENTLETLKNDSDNFTQDVELAHQYSHLSQKMTANKKYLMQYLISLKPLEPFLEIEHSAKSLKNLSEESSPSSTHQSLFKKHTGALAATTAATLTLGYLYLKHS